MPFENSAKEASGEASENRRFCYPNGIVSASPGLRGTSYPGLPAAWISTPTGLRQVCAAEPQPRWGWLPRHIFPRVARSSQPWALRWNPLGIPLPNSPKALRLARSSRRQRLVPSRATGSVLARSTLGRFRTQQRVERVVRVTERKQPIRNVIQRAARGFEPFGERTEDAGQFIPLRQ